MDYTWIPNSFLDAGPNVEIGRIGDRSLRLIVLFAKSRLFDSDSFYFTFIFIYILTSIKLSRWVPGTERIEKDPAIVSQLFDVFLVSRTQQAI